MFWITNGWNDFIGNMAAGAGSLRCSLLVRPGLNNDSAGRDDSQ